MGTSLKLRLSFHSKNRVSTLTYNIIVSHTVCTDQKLIYLFGGADLEQRTSELYTFDPSKYFYLHFVQNQIYGSCFNNQMNQNSLHQQQDQVPIVYIVTIVFICLVVIQEKEAHILMI